MFALDLEHPPIWLTQPDREAAVQAFEPGAMSIDLMSPSGDKLSSVPMKGFALIALAGQTMSVPPKSVAGLAPTCSTFRSQLEPR